MTKLEEEFGKLKTLYSKEPEKAEELKDSMRKNLIKRTDKTEIVVLSGETCEIDSNNIEDLYKIDAALREERRIKNTPNIDMASRNIYTKDNPYPSKK